MEHRYTERYASDLSILIYQYKLPVAIGRIKNGSRLGVLIESDFDNIDCEHQISLEVLLNRNSNKHKLQRMEFKALVIHKTVKGFGAALEIQTDEQTDLFMEILQAVNEKSSNPQVFAMVANT